jgi:hypothetical protein
MSVWNGCRTENGSIEAEASYEVDVRIDVNEIVVTYAEEDRSTNVVWRGKNNGDGHFELKCPEQNGHATLHRFPEGKFLEGFWKEGEYVGFWRIWLK